MNTRFVISTVLLVGAVSFSAAVFAAPPAAAAKAASADVSLAASAHIEDWRVARGYKIAPVPLDVQGRSKELVGLGSYLVNAVGGCNDCHTWPNYAANGDPFRGQPKMVNADNYLAGGRPFGPFRSRNLTPNPDSTDTEEERFEEFVSVIRTGLDPHQAHPEISPLLQVMPWPVYQDLTDRDLHAIFQDLESIPHAEPYCKGEHLSEPLCQP